MPSRCKFYPKNEISASNYLILPKSRIKPSNKGSTARALTRIIERTIFPPERRELRGNNDYLIQAIFRKIITHIDSGIENHPLPGVNAPRSWAKLSLTGRPIKSWPFNSHAYQVQNVDNQTELRWQFNAWFRSAGLYISQRNLVKYLLSSFSCSKFNMCEALGAPIIKGTNTNINNFTCLPKKLLPTVCGTKEVTNTSFRKAENIWHLTNLHLFLIHTVWQIPNKNGFWPSSRLTTAGSSFLLQQLKSRQKSNIYRT